MKALKNFFLAITLLSASLSMANINYISNGILSFSGEAKNNGNLITYSTSDKEEGTSYSLEKSYDALNFFKLKATEKESNDTNKHSFEDNAPQNLTYYRIVTTKLDGKKSFSNIIAVLNNDVKATPDLVDGTE